MAVIAEQDLLRLLKLDLGLIMSAPETKRDVKMGFAFSGTQQCLYSASTAHPLGSRTVCYVRQRRVSGFLKPMNSSNDGNPAEALMVSLPGDVTGWTLWSLKSEESAINSEDRLSGLFSGWTAVPTVLRVNNYCNTWWAAWCMCIEIAGRAGMGLTSLSPTLFNRHFMVHLSFVL